MVDVLFFASIREQLGTDKIALDLADQTMSVNEVKQHLIKTYGQEWEGALFAANIINAVNQKVVDGDYAVSNGDELAFFPPVTGG